MTYNDIKEFWKTQKPLGRSGKQFWLMVNWAIDKQIPQQVEQDSYYKEIKLCPSCKKVTCDTLRSNEKDQYCRFCGQKLSYESEVKDDRSMEEDN